MNLWSTVMTTDFTSDKPKIAQNNVLKLSSILEELRNQNESCSETCAFSKIRLDCRSSKGHILNIYNVLEVNKLMETHFRWYSRCKCIVVFHSQVVRVQVEHSHHECHKNSRENHQKLKNIFYCSSQWDLQRSKALIGWQNVCDANKTQYYCNCIETFRYKLWVWGQPVAASWNQTKARIFIPNTLLELRNSFSDMYMMQTYQAENTVSQMAVSRWPGQNNVY